MSGATFGIGDTVRVQNSDYRNGLVRKVVKMHHSGKYAYLEPGFNEHAAELYFHISKLVKVSPGLLETRQRSASRAEAIEVTRQRLVELFIKDGSALAGTVMRLEAESIVRDLEKAGHII